MSLRYQVDSDDIRFLETAIRDFRSGKQEFNLGDGGTSFRFFALRISREKGRFHVRASPSLLRRPQNELVEILRQLGVMAVMTADGLVIDSEGGVIPREGLVIQTSESSQFLSAVLLASWKLSSQLRIRLEGDAVSTSYSEMTLRMLQKCGLEFQKIDREIHVRSGNNDLKNPLWKCEPDMSSAFALSAAAVINGEAKIVDFPQNSDQPDVIFVKILESMGANMVFESGMLTVRKSPKLRGGVFNLRETPDLFPVLAVLCAFAVGPSALVGAPHLRHKESDRIQKTSELLQLMGVPIEATDDGLRILGGPQRMSESCRFDCSSDHRMAFAAGVFLLAGAQIDLIGASSVTKSFGEFWKVTGLSKVVRGATL
ncbi:MAG TPA: hypothetical protein PLU50_07680 [Pseudobdellovibrionaceae bacterium]|nr:hypothetical protein [Pseudobdellovibrionaceae bacterium]